jgi:sulfur-oxidizing protein SoxX
MTDVSNRLIGAAGVLAVALGALAAIPATASADEQLAQMIEAGEKLAFDRSAGNCLACHHIDGGQSPGSIGPPLIAMNVRYSDKDKLRAQIWDATIANPESPMPPFGSHHILSDEQIDQVVEFIWNK